MFLVPIVQLAVCLLILSWLLKQKPGEKQELLQAE